MGKICYDFIAYTQLMNEETNKQTNNRKKATKNEAINLLKLFLYE